MASAFPVVLVLFVVAGLMAVSWFSVRKGPQQTCVHTHSHAGCAALGQPLTNYAHAQTHPNQPDVNLRVFILDVGYSLLGPVTSTRK
jgi:hypothetical protein